MLTPASHKLRFLNCMDRQFVFKLPVHSPTAFNEEIDILCCLIGAEHLHLQS
jgi:hypothetical protein